MSAPGRRLALDYGRRRIGLAVCDGLGISMKPLPPLGSTTPAADLAALERIVAEEEIVGIVLGMPLTLAGDEGRAAQEVKLFGAVLRERLRLPVDEIDERMTTKAAHALLKSAGASHAERKPRLDSAAAMLILRTWLDRRKLPPPP
jgi:putative Holliday junction resolvase